MGTPDAPDKSRGAGFQPAKNPEKTAGYKPAPRENGLLSGASLLPVTTPNYLDGQECPFYSRKQSFENETSQTNEKASHNVGNSSGQATFSET
jgi:hypothetical protein